jgi:O-succinylbenzoic acid--CoA ligase
MNLSVRGAARDEPERLAFIGEHASISYDGLLRPLSEAAGTLLSRGMAAVREKRPVTFTATIDLETVVKVCACIEVGAFFLPIHPRLTPREKARLVAAAKSPFVWEGPFSGIRDAPARLEELPVVPDDTRPLAMLYTSGSSGKPKGVVLSRAAFLASAEASAHNLGWEEADRWLLSLPLAHVGGLSILTRCLIARRTVVLCPSADPGKIAESISRHRVTLMSAVPAVIERLLALSPAWKPPPHLRAVLLGGGAIPPAVLREGKKRGLSLLPTYGMTETCSQVATWPYGEEPPERGAAKALPGIDLRVRSGRIAVRGPVLFDSYWPEGGPAGEVDEEGWFETGDCGEIDAQGTLRVWGRADEMIVTGGENVSPREVEDALRAFPAVRDVAAFGVADDRYGEVVGAAVVWASGAPRDTGALAVHLAKELASFKRPRKIAFVEALPRTASGKVDRHTLLRTTAGKLLPLSYGRQDG